MNKPRTCPEGVTCWVDIEVAEVAAATRFYGDLFGWMFVEAAPGSERRYLAAQLDGQDAAAMVLSTTDTEWTRDAQVRDPQGAVFTASQYSPPSA
jgi:hypothetical protein